MVQRRLGAGAFGVVYEAYDRQQRGLVALKVLRVADADALYRFKKGFRSLADIRHPNLVSFYELTTHGGTWFFSMELIKGRELTDALCPDGAPCRDYRRVRHVFRQLALGLDTVHRHGKVHRDIKPPNVLVTDDDHVKLLDFGLVTELEQGPRASATAGQMVGTPAYMSPEQAMGGSDRTAGDWYSVGVMLYQVVTGDLPFDGSLMEILNAKQRGLPEGQLRRRAPELPEDLEALCGSLLAPDPEERVSGGAALNLLGADAAAAPTPGSFVGRGDLLAELRDAFEASRNATVLLGVRGSSGIGKTALVEHFASQVEADFADAVVLRGRCYVQESVPYKAWDSVLDALSRHLMGLDGERVRCLMPDHVGALARLFPALRRVPAIAEASKRPEEPEDAEPQTRRRRAVGALRDLFALLAAESHLVLMIDDLQWGDLDSFLLLDDLLGGAEPPPLLLITCFRKEDEASSPFLRGLAAQREALRWRGIEVRDVEVEELSREESTQLLETLGGDVRLPSGHLEALVLDAGGSPLLLSELARYAPERSPSQSGPPGNGRVTAELRVRDVLRRRIDELGDPARRLLETVAVAGQPLQLAVARDAADLGADTPQAVAELRSDKLVRLTSSEGTERLEPYHDRIREAAVHRLGDGELRVQHRRLALALESTGTADPETLVVHFRATEEDERARRYALSAAHRAADALAFERAARLYRLALDLSEEGDEGRYQLRVELGRALANAGRSRDAADSFLRAVGDSGVVDPLEAQRQAAEQLLVGGHIERGLKVLRHVLRTVGMELEERNWRSLWRLWLLRLKLRWRGFEFEERSEGEVEEDDLRRIDVCWSVEIGLCLVDVLHASEFHARHLVLALDAGEPQRIARGLAMEVFFGAMEGVDTQEVLDLALDLAGRVEGSYASSLTEMAAGMRACSEGRWGRAARRLDRAEIHLMESRRGVAWELDTVRQFRSVALFQLGRWRELFDDLPRLTRQARDQDDLYLQVHLHHRVRCPQLLAEDRPGDAEALLDRSLEGWAYPGFHYQHFGHLTARVTLDLYRGTGRRAWDHLETRWDELARSMIQRIEMVMVESHDLRGRCALAALESVLREAGGTQAPGPRVEVGRAGAFEADVVAMRRWIAQIEDDARTVERAGSRWSEALADTLRAGLASARGQWTEALDRLGTAERAFDAADMPLHAAAVGRRAGQLLGDEERIAACDEGMRKRGVRRPERWCAVLAPGSWTRTLATPHGPGSKRA
ncbi:MAG: protein kinase [Acidobacteriota bacterium]